MSLKKIAIGSDHGGFFLKEKLTPETWNRFINFQPKDKVMSLIELT